MRALLVLPLLLAACSSGAPVRKAGGPPADCPTSTTVRAQVRTDVTEALSYDYRHLASHFAEVKARLTGDFLAEYSRTTSTKVTATALKDHAVAVFVPKQVAYLDGACTTPRYLVTGSQATSSASKHNVSPAVLLVTMTWNRQHYRVSALTLQ